MKSIVAFATGTLLLLATTAIANTPEEARCPTPDSGAYRISWERKETGTYELASAAWCCCNTAVGQCCNYAPTCTPSVTGCACL